MSRRGYGVQPHGHRLEGYPTNQATPLKRQVVAPSDGPIRASSRTSRGWSLRAIDAASRPEQLSLICLYMKNLHYRSHGL
jgi:hypothetical protein